MGKSLKAWLDRVASLGLLILLSYLIVQRVPLWYHQFRIQGANVDSGAFVSDLSGQSFDLLKLGGGPKVLVFWATWCTPCELELKRIQGAIDEGEISPDPVVAISLGEEIAVVNRVRQDRGYSFRVVVDREGEASRRFGVEVTPTVVFLEGDGKVDWLTSGVSPTLIHRMKSFLGRAKP